MELVGNKFTTSELEKCFEELGFIELPTDWCDLLFESDCHVVEVYKTSHKNMYRLLFLKRFAKGKTGAHIGFFIGGLVHSADAVSEFVEFIRADELC